MKREMTKRFFIACMLVFLITLGMVFYVVGVYITRRNVAELKDRAVFASAVIEHDGWEAMKEIRSGGETRITIVDKSGKVLYDSIKRPEEMANHADREEIREALTLGEGDSERYSETILRKTVYYAVRMRDGNVMRISMQQDTVWVVIVNMLNPIVIVVLLMVILSMVLASQFASKIMQPINRLDAENPDDRDIYDEMKPFVRRLIAQNQQIYRQMNELREEHRKQDTMRREFTANVSHELKTPLTSISGFAEIMRDGMVKQEDVPHFADNIYKESQRLMALVNDILKLSRLEDGEIHGSMADVSLQEVCSEVAERLGMQAQKAQVKLLVEGEDIHIQGIPGMVEEIVYNVCDNGIKYNRRGGFVKMTTGIMGDEAFVRIRDKGIGIPIEDQDRIFERFYRVNKSHSKEVGGTGLGLSIVKHGMALHQGRITLESREGDGTVITLYFPAPEETETE